MGAMLAVEESVPAAALRILRAAPAVDAVLVGGNGELPVHVEYRARLRGPEARSVAERLRGAPAPAIVVSKETTARAREILGELGIGVVDAAGNAHIDLPGVVIHVERPVRSNASHPLGGRLRGKTAVIVQALLLDPDREWKVIDLGERAGASLGMVHRALSSLERRELVSAEGAGRTRRRRLVNPGALLDLLAEDLEDRGVETLPAYRFSQAAEDLPRALSARLRKHGIAHAVTGTAAANLLAPHLTAVPVTAAWITADWPLADAAGAAEAEPTERGPNLLLMQAGDDGPLAFAEERSGVALANVFRVYVDARRDLQRGPEQAEHLRREAIGF